MRKIVVVIRLLLLLCVVGCSPNPVVVEGWGDDSAESEEQLPELELKPELDEKPQEEWVTSIAALKNLYVGSTQRITQSLVITGVVTANNVMGEFPDRVIIEDESGAVELCIDDSLILRFGLTIGSQVTLNCSDLYMAARGGVLMLGAAPTGDDLVDLISDVELQRRVKSSPMSTPMLPRKVMINQLSVSLISCYVCLEGVEFVSSDPTTQFCERNPENGRYVSTIHTLEDESGRQIDLYVPGTVEYAGVTTPLGRGSICCVVENFGGRFSVRVVYNRVQF